MDVLIIVMDDDVETGLARSAMDHGWPLLYCSNAGQALVELCQYRPRVLVVQLSWSVTEALKLIRLTRGHWRQIPVVAVAPSHHEEIERAVRSAGAGCYLPLSADTGLVDQAVGAVLEREHGFQRSGAVVTARLMPASKDAQG